MPTDKMTQREYRAEVKRIIKEAKNKPCFDCEESFPDWAMDFHHKDGAKKRFNICDALTLHVAIEELRREIKACIVICPTCHRYRNHGTIRGKKE